MSHEQALGFDCQHHNQPGMADLPKNPSIERWKQDLDRGSKSPLLMEGIM